MPSVHLALISSQTFERHSPPLPLLSCFIVVLYPLWSLFPEKKALKQHIEIRRSEIALRGESIQLHTPSGLLTGVQFLTQTAQLAYPSWCSISNFLRNRYRWVVVVTSHSPTEVWGIVEPLRRYFASCFRCKKDKMSFTIRNQQDLAHLCYKDPLPASITFPPSGTACLDERHIPFIFHNGLTALLIQGKLNLADSCKSQLKESSVKNMFGEYLSNSLSIESLRIWNFEICELFLHSLHRRPILDSLRSLAIWKPLINHKNMLLFNRAVKFAPQLVSLRLPNMILELQSATVITNTANILYLLYRNSSLEELIVSGKSYEMFSALRLGVLHNLLTEEKDELPESAFCYLGGAFVVKQIFAQLARKCKGLALAFDTKDFDLITPNQQKYIASKKICSNFQPFYGLTTFVLR